MTNLLYIITAISLINLIVVGIIFSHKIQKLKEDIESLSSTNKDLQEKKDKYEKTVKRVRKQMEEFSQNINNISETSTRDYLSNVIMNLPWPKKIKEEDRKSVTNKLIDTITIESKILKCINTIIGSYIFYDLTEGYKSDETIDEKKKSTVLARFIYISLFTMNAVLNYENIMKEYKKAPENKGDNDIYEYILSNKWNSNIENDLTKGHQKVPFWARVLKEAISDIQLENVKLGENEYFILMGFNFYNKKEYNNQ